MRDVLFFNSDEILDTYIKNHSTGKIKPILLCESVNHIPLSKIEKYKKCEAISVFVHSEPINPSRLDYFENLKVIATRSTGFNHIDLEYCKKRNIAVLNVPKYGESTVAEFAFGLLINIARHIIPGRNGMAHNHVEIAKYMGFDLLGKTIGIIGTGSIGEHMIKLAKGFNMNILAYDLFPKKELQEFYVSNYDEILLKVSPPCAKMLAIF